MEMNGKKVVFFIGAMFLGVCSIGFGHTVKKSKIYIGTEVPNKKTNLITLVDTQVSSEELEKQDLLEQLSDINENYIEENGFTVDEAVASKFVEENAEELTEEKATDIILEQQENIQITDLPQEMQDIINKLVKIDGEIAEDNQAKALENTTTISIKNTTKKVEDLYKANIKTADNIRKTYDELNAFQMVIISEAYRASTFVSLVKSGGAWDLKQPSKLGYSNKYSLNNKNQTGEYIGNHHYGYMGRAIRYSQTTLAVAAGAYQLISGTSEGFKAIGSYFDDPKDTEAIKDGCKLYDSGVRP